MTLKNNTAPFLIYLKLCASFRSRWWIQTGVTIRKRSIRVKIIIFVPSWPWNLTDDLEKQQGTSSTLLPALCIHSHPWNQIGITVQKRPIQYNIDDFMSRVTLKFDGWPWKITGHLFCATSSFVHHFVAISEFKLELQPGSAQFGSKSANICPLWPWNLTDDLEKQQSTSSYLFQAVCIIA